MQPPQLRFAALGGDRIANQKLGAGTVPLLIMRARLVSLETPRAQHGTVVAWSTTPATVT